MKKIYIFILLLFPVMAIAGSVCPPDLTVHANNSDCTATVVLPDPLFGGTCSLPQSVSVTIPGYTVAHNGQHWIAYNLPEGHYTVIYSTHSPCPGYFYCTVQLTVLGGGGLTAVCDMNTVVSLGQNGVGRVYAETFNDHSNSTCGDIVEIKVRRLHQGWCPPGVKDDTQFGPYVEFCCEDIQNNPISVVLRVRDSHGQVNECTAYVYVEDRIPPVIYCLPDITVDCDYPINYNNLSEFGTIRKLQSQCGPIYVGGQFCGYDGYVVDNCDVNIIESFTVELNDCGLGYIKRLFKAIDPSGNVSSCVQRIYIRDRYPFSASNITWPSDVTINECHPSNVGPEVTGKPTYHHTTCSILAVTYVDQIYTYVGTNSDACMKILRTWKVLDCCQWDRFSGKGLFTHVQEIRITDGEAPVFLDCNDIDICATDVNGCSGYIELNPQVEDCTPQEHISWNVYIDYGNDGTIDLVRHQSDVSGYYPFGTHKITWEANDGCRNTSTCTRLITIRDCQKPTPVCYASIATVVVETGGTVRVDAKVHDAGSFDNCTSNENLRFSFSTDASDNIKIFSCDDLGVNVIPIYVTDEAGNQSSCFVRLDIQDNHGNCLDSLTVHLSGAIMTPEGEGVENVSLSVLHPDFGEHLITSNENGEFEYASYTDLSNFESVMVMPLRADNPLNGVTSFDLFLMHKMMLGDLQFDNAYQQIAADINNDGRFTAVDLVELKNLILGHHSDFLSNLSWRFIDGMIEFDEQNPLNFSEMQFVDLPEYNSRFIGVKIGDMNQDAVASGAADSRSSNFVDFVIEDRYVTAGEDVEFTIQLPENAPLAYQLYIENYNYYSISKLISGEKEDNSFINNDFASVVYFDGNHGNEITVTIRPSINGYLSDIVRLADVRPSLMTDGNYEESQIVLRFNNVYESTELLVDVAPNPMDNSTQLYISSPEDQSAEIQMYNVNGNLVLNKVIHLTKGKNAISLGTDLYDLTAGVYYINVKSNKTSVKKTVVKM